MSKALSKYKVVALGDSSVGKTSILNKYTYSSFDEYYAPTLGIDFMSKTVYLEDRVIRLQLWDTAGQERFRSLVPSYIRDSAAAIVVFDLTSRQSFEDTEHWAKEVRDERGGDVVGFLVGNKSDLVDQRCVTREEAEQKALKLKMRYVETSASKGDGVSELFSKLCELLPVEDEGIDDDLDGQITQTEIVDSDHADEPGSKGCC